MVKVEGCFICFLTWVLIAFADLVITSNCIYGSLKLPSFALGLSGIGFTLFSLFQIVVMLAFASHLRSAFTDPGKTPNIPLENIFEEEPRYCEICNQYKSSRTHHCKKCNICIHRMDHHCLWINNCVGIKNHKYFVLFLFYIALSAFVGVAIIIYCGTLYLKRGGNFLDWRAFLVFVACFECIIFGIFTSDFLKEQIYILKDNQSTIEKFNRKFGEDFGTLENFKTIFGKNVFCWLLPVAPDLDINYNEPLYNYSERELRKKNPLKIMMVSPEYSRIG